MNLLVAQLVPLILKLKIASFLQESDDVSKYLTIEERQRKRYVLECLKQILQAFFDTPPSN